MGIFLETKRLIIKPSELGDLDNLCALQADHDVMEYIGKGVRSSLEVNKWLEKSISHHKKHGFSFGSVFEKESGIFVGQAGIMYLNYDDAQPDIEIGYRLYKKFWSNGYATELAKALIQWGFKNLSVNTLVAVTHPKNTRSRHVLEKSGMNYVGIVNCYDAEVAKYEILKNNIEYKRIELIPATLKKYPIIQNMGRFYVYDMSEYMGSQDGWEIPKDGLYECIDFKKYWEVENAFPFLVFYGSELAGFAIIDKKGSDSTIDFNMAQFFILRKFKNKGIGKYVAQECFIRFPGIWEVMVSPGNEGAYRFWRATIKDYTNNNFTEYTRDIAHFNNSRKNIFKFDSQVVS